MIFLDKELFLMMKGKHKQSFLSLQFGGIRTITIYNPWASCGTLKEHRLHFFRSNVYKKINYYIHEMETK